MSNPLEVIFLIVLCLWLGAQCVFYKSYFRLKQRNMGNDPNEVLRKEFGGLWWLLR
jgi:hypothetical protein